FDFSASLNGAPLTSTYKTSSDVELPESHVALAESVCSYFVFDAHFNPGESTLRIEYTIFPDYTDGDGIGTDWKYSYPIWPAKNWVRSFRAASWQVRLP